MLISSASSIILHLGILGSGTWELNMIGQQVTFYAQFTIFHFCYI